jgi:hypothetical protein
MRSTIPFLHALFDLLLAPVCLGCDGAIDPRADARLVCVRCRSVGKPHVGNLAQHHITIIMAK